MSAVDDAFRTFAEMYAEATARAVVRSPEFGEQIRSHVRAAVAELKPHMARLEQLEQQYGIPRSTARRYIREGRLKATKVGRTVLVDVSTLRALGPDEIAAVAARAGK